MSRLLAICFCFVLTLTAQGAIVYSGLQDIAIPTGVSDFSIDIDNAATAGSDFPGADINPFFGGSWFMNNASFQPARTGTNFDDAIIRLPSGALISSALNFSTGIGASGSPNNHMGAGSNQFLPGVEGYLVFQFIKNNASGPFFGWVRVVFTNGAPGGLIRDWAYDDSGAPMLAGAPEPGRVLLLVAGLMTLAQRRRRR